jgi:hypothetical protein
MKKPILVVAAVLAAAIASCAQTFTMGGGSLVANPSGTSGPQVPNLVFSAGFNKTGSPWCPVDGAGKNALIYSYRVWDDGLKWSQVEPSNGTYMWTTNPTNNAMDTTINNRALAGGCPGTPMSIIYTLGGTPLWATACSGQPDPGPCFPGKTSDGFGGGTQCASPNDLSTPPAPDSSCLPPADINADGTGANAFSNFFINNLVTRYKGKITYYEGGNEHDSPNFWCQAPSPVPCGGGNSSTTANTPALQRLVRRNWDAKNIIHCIDPAAKMLSPSFHVGTALTWFHEYNITSINAPAGVAGQNGVPAGCNWSAQTVTGQQTYDYVNVHPRGTGAAAPDPAGNWNPEALITAYNNTVKECQNDSIQNCPAIVFGDELGYNSSTEGGGNTDAYASYVARTYILCASLNMYCYWYQWDTSGALGPSNEPQGTAYDTVATWMLGSTVTTQCSENGTIWTCIIAKGGTQFEIAWDDSQSCPSVGGCTTASHSFGAQYTSYTNLFGVNKPTTGGNGSAPLGIQPIELTGGPSGNTGSAQFTLGTRK